MIYIGGYHLVYAVYRAGIKQEMRVYLQKNKDTRLGTYLSFAVKDKQVSDPYFEWEETGKEFSYRGEMYDVVTLSCQSDSIRICALKDERENNLAGQLAVIHQSSHQNNAANTRAVLHFFSVFTVEPEQVCQGQLSSVILHTAYFHTKPVLNTGEVTTPPPRC